MKGILSNILIQPNVITKKNCDYLIDYIDKSSKEPAGVFDPEKNSSGIPHENSSRVDSNVRNVYCADPSPIIDELKDLFQNIVNHVINPFYDFEVRDSELPQLLHYTKGGHYVAHIDAEAPWKSPTGEVIWKKCMDRDLSAVLFLNNEYKGGDLSFPDLKIKIQPEPGLLVCFPSSAWYKHGVEPVISGNRYTIVTWMRVKGFLTQEEQEKELMSKYSINKKNT